MNSKMDERFNRRAILKRVMMAGVFWFIAPWKALSANRRSDNLLAFSGIPPSSDYFEAQTAIKIGREYVKRVKGSDTVGYWQEKLEHRVLPFTNSMEEVYDNSTLLNTLKKAIQEDFEAGNTVVIKGWVLAETEADHCALYFMTQTSMTGHAY
ncbi:MAG: hypothetical protein OEX02_12695 [Cyclobacteriaceae bacterium]|nr:hypothetical protein [Cyclobacteriaceae bacterium]